MDAFADSVGCADANKSRTLSLDSGVYVQVEINTDECEEAPEPKEHSQNDGTSPNDEEPADKNFKEEKCAGMDGLNPDPVTADGPEGSVSALIPELDAFKSVLPHSAVVAPPALPPKRYQRSSQGPGLNPLIEEGESIYQTPALVGRRAGCSQYLEMVSEKVPDAQRSCTLTPVTVELKRSPQPSPKPPRKPPRTNMPNRTETTGQQVEDMENVPPPTKAETDGAPDNHAVPAGNPQTMIPPQLPAKQRRNRPGSPSQTPQPCSEVRDQTENNLGEKKQDSKQRGDGQLEETDGGSRITERSSQQGATVMESMSKSSVNMVHDQQENQKQAHSTDCPPAVDSPKDKPRTTEDYSDTSRPSPGTKEPETRLDSNLPHEAPEAGDAVDGHQTSHKPSPKRRLKNFAKKIVTRFKESREEKPRRGGVELGHASQDHTGIKEEEEGMDEDGVGRTTLPAMEPRFTRRQVVSDSPFGSFKVYSPVRLVEELLSGDEWSQYLSTETPPPAQHSDPGPAAAAGPGSAAVPQTESIYEDVDIARYTTEHPSPTPPQILVEESDTSHMSVRTRSIYETVEIMKPVQEANTSSPLPKVKFNGVLDSSVQKYLIKLSKKRKYKVRKQRGHRRHRHTDALQSPSSTSLQIFNASIFYRIPAPGEQHQLSTETESVPENVATS